MTEFHGYFIDIKPLPLRDHAGWTTHFSIYRDSGNSMDLIQKVEMGNTSATRDDAYRTGIVEAERVIRAL